MTKQKYRAYYTPDALLLVRLISEKYNIDLLTYASPGRQINRTIEGIIEAYKAKFYEKVLIYCTNDAVYFYHPVAPGSPFNMKAYLNGCWISLDDFEMIEVSLNEETKIGDLDENINCK